MGGRRYPNGIITACLMDSKEIAKGIPRIYLMDSKYILQGFKGNFNYGLKGSEGDPDRILQHNHYTDFLKDCFVK